MADKESLDEIEEMPLKGTHEDNIRRYRAHTTSSASDRRFKLHSARTYFYENEAACEKNMETFLRSIEAVAGNNYEMIEDNSRNSLFFLLDSTHGTGFSAIKLTALGRPSLLVRLPI